MSERASWFYRILISKRDTKRRPVSRAPRAPEPHEAYSGLIRLHVLHHASEGAVFGLGMIEELGRHGYRLSPGTLYPMLRELEREGLLRSERRRPLLPKPGRSLWRVGTVTLPLSRF